MKFRYINILYYLILSILMTIFGVIGLFAGGADIIGLAMIFIIMGPVIFLINLDLNPKRPIDINLRRKN